MIPAPDLPGYLSGKYATNPTPLRAAVQKCEPVSACRDHGCLQTCNNNYNAAGVCQNGIPKYTTTLGTYFYKRGKKTEKEAGYCIPNNLACDTQTSEYRATPSTAGEHNDASERKGSGSGLAQFIKKGRFGMGIEVSGASNLAGRQHYFNVYTFHMCGST